MKPRFSWHAHLLLLRPRRVAARLEQVLQQGALQRAPNLWQIELAVLRMWHRILFRSQTIGTCTLPVRATWRARWLRFRPLRFPFLVWERAIAPWDLSGFLSSHAQFIRHLLGAHHDGTQCVYDLQILSMEPGALEHLREAVARVVEVDDRRSRWLRDLCVFERYHDDLLVAIEAVQAGSVELRPQDAHDPDISFWALMRWCARQPDTPAKWWRAWREGRFEWERGLLVEAA